MGRVLIGLRGVLALQHHHVKVEIYRHHRAHLVHLPFALGLRTVGEYNYHCGTLLHCIVVMLCASVRMWACLGRGRTHMHVYALGLGGIGEGTDGMLDILKHPC